MVNPVEIIHTPSLRTFMVVHKFLMVRQNKEIHRAAGDALIVKL